MKTLLIPTSDWLGHPFPQRLNHIFERLAEDHEIHVIRFNFLTRKNDDTKLIVHEFNDMQFTNLGLYYLLNSPYLYDKIKKVISSVNFDNVVVSNLLAGYVSTKAIDHKLPIIFDLPDHFPSIGAGYLFNRNSIYSRITELMMEKLLFATLRNVDLTVTCSDALIGYLNSHGITDTLKISNGVSEFFFEDVNNKKDIVKNLDLSGQLIIGYIGSIEFWLDIFPLLHAINILKEKIDVKLFIIGGKLQSKIITEIKQKIKQLEIEKNVLWLDFIPHKDVPQYIEAMDICTIPFNVNNLTTYYSAPNKLFEYFAMGKPVISSYIPEIVNNYKGMVEFADSAQSYVTSVLKILNSYENKPSSQELRKNIARNMTWEKTTKKYEKTLLSYTNNQANM